MEPNKQNQDEVKDNSLKRDETSIKNYYDNWNNVDIDKELNKIDEVVATKQTELKKQVPQAQDEELRNKIIQTMKQQVKGGQLSWIQPKENEQEKSKTETVIKVNKRQIRKLKTKVENLKAQGDRFLAQNQLQQAIDTYEQCLPEMKNFEGDQLFQDLYQNLSSGNFKFSKYQKSEELCSYVLEKDANQQWAYLQRAESRKMMNKLTHALQDYYRADALSPSEDIKQKIQDILTIQKQKAFQRMKEKKRKMMERKRKEQKRAPRKQPEKEESQTTDQKDDVKKLDKPQVRRAQKSGGRQRQRAGRRGGKGGRGEGRGFRKPKNFGQKRIMEKRPVLKKKKTLDNLHGSSNSDSDEGSTTSEEDTKIVKRQARVFGKRHNTMPDQLTFRSLQFIDGKRVLKKSKNKLHKGKVKTKRGIGFDLEPQYCDIAVIPEFKGKKSTEKKPKKRRMMLTKFQQQRTRRNRNAVPQSCPISMTTLRAEQIKMIDKKMKKSTNKVKKGKIKNKRGLSFNLEEDILTKNMKKLKKKYKEKRRQNYPKQLETLNEIDEEQEQEGEEQEQEG